MDVRSGPSTDASDLAHEVRSTGTALDRSVVALRAHASQIAPLIHLMGEDDFLGQWWATESFVAAALGAKHDVRRRIRGDATGRYHRAPQSGRAPSRHRVVHRDTGDRNPLHYDEELATQTRFGGIIVQGGVTSGLLNAVVAEDLPGPGSVFLRVAWEFKAPVYPGDEITAEVEVLEVHDTKPVARLRTTITKADGTVVLDGDAHVYRVGVTGGGRDLTS